MEAIDATSQHTGEDMAQLPRLDAYFWAGAMIWAGLIFGAESLGVLPQIGEAGAWTWIFLGAGLGGLGLSLYSLSSPDYASPTAWDWIFGAVLVAIGLGGFFGLDIALPVILIGIGVAALAGQLLRRN